MELFRQWQHWHCVLSPKVRHVSARVFLFRDYTSTFGHVSSLSVLYCFVFSIDSLLVLMAFYTGTQKEKNNEKRCCFIDAPIIIFCCQRGIFPQNDSLCKISTPKKACVVTWYRWVCSIWCFRHSGATTRSFPK